MAIATTQQPIQWVRENILVSRTGTAYGIWKLTGQPYGLATPEKKEKVRQVHQELYRRVKGDYSLLGIVAMTSPDQIVEAMLHELNDPSEEWLRECELVNEELSFTPSGERVYFLVVPLTGFNVREWWQKTRRSFEGSLTRALGLAATPPGEDLFSTWKNRMQAVEEAIPEAFEPKRAGLGALQWITRHLTSRGAQASMPFRFDEPEDSSASAGAWFNATGALMEPALDEGAMTDMPGDRLARQKILGRPYLKVDSVETVPSYQQFGVIGSGPQRGFDFPDEEFVNIAATMPQDIDFCVRMTSTPAPQVKSKNRRAERNIKDQGQQRAGSDNSLTGADSDLEQAATDLHGLDQALGASEREVQVSGTVIFAASGEDPQQPIEDLRAIREHYENREWTVQTPLGGQEQLFWDFWPGSTPSATSNEFAQITTGHDWAMAIPMSSEQVGTRHGLRIGRNITTGRLAPVITMFAGLTESNLSGSFGVCGDLGSGKSFFLKTVASHAISRGEKLVVVDHSDNQEWLNLARRLTDVGVIDFTAPEVSLDPLRIFAENPSEAQESAHALICSLLQISPTEAAVAHHELMRMARGEIELPTMKALVEHLWSDEVDERNRAKATELAQMLEIFLHNRFAAAFFDTELPVMDFDHQATVFCTAGLNLPSEREMERAEVNLSLDKVVGQAVYDYLARVSKSISYADDSQEVLFIVDECHHMTGSGQGEDIIIDMVKTGRKHKAAVGLGTHVASEFGSQRLRALLPQRFVFRHQDPDSARENLRWLDESYLEQAYVDLLTKDMSPIDPKTDEVPMDRRGECLYRDHVNRVALVQVIGPLEPGRRDAVTTTPPKKEVAA